MLAYLYLISCCRLKKLLPDSTDRRKEEIIYVPLLIQFLLIAPILTALIWWDVFEWPRVSFLILLAASLYVFNFRYAKNNFEKIEINHEKLSAATRKKYYWLAYVYVWIALGTMFCLLFVPPIIQDKLGVRFCLLC